MSKRNYTLWGMAIATPNVPLEAKLPIVKRRWEEEHSPVFKGCTHQGITNWIHCHSLCNFFDLILDHFSEIYKYIYTYPCYKWDRQKLQICHDSGPPQTRKPEAFQLRISWPWTSPNTLPETNSEFYTRLFSYPTSSSPILQEMYQC